MRPESPLLPSAETGVENGRPSHCIILLLHADHCECLRPSSRCPESITCVTPATRGPAVNPRLTLGTHHRHHHTILLFDNILNWELFSEKFSCDQATMYNFCTIQIYMWWEKIAFFLYFPLYAYLTTWKVARSDLFICIFLIYCLSCLCIERHGKALWWTIQFSFIWLVSSIT